MQRANINRRTSLTAAFLLAASTGSMATCFEEAARQYGLNEGLLRAVVQVESGGNNRAINGSHQEKTGSVDIGLMQINSRWLDTPTFKRQGITREALRNDACLNLKVGAWILRDDLDRHGDSWDAIGAYNASCTELKGKDCQRARMTYANKVYQAWTRIARRDPEVARAAHAQSPARRIATVNLDYQE